MITDRQLLAKAIAAGLATPDEVALYARGPDPDPLADLTLEQRWDHVIRHAAAGIWSTCQTPVIINGKRIPPPPTRRGHTTRPRTNGTMKR